MIEKIAKIRKTRLGYEDHGIFTLSLDLDYGGSGQGLGGYALDQYDPSLKRRVGTAYGHEFIIRTLAAIGVSKWEDVAGKTILVLFEDDNWGSQPVGLKNLPTEPGGTFIFEELSA